jgi:hypothetical protein
MENSKINSVDLLYKLNGFAKKDASWYLDFIFDEFFFRRADLISTPNAVKRWSRQKSRLGPM